MLNANVFSFISIMLMLVLMYLVNFIHARKHIKQTLLFTYATYCLFIVGVAFFQNTLIETDMFFWVYIITVVNWFAILWTATFIFLITDTYKYYPTLAYAFSLPIFFFIVFEFFYIHDYMSFIPNEQGFRELKYSDTWYIKLRFSYILLGIITALSTCVIRFFNTTDIRQKKLLRLVVLSLIVPIFLVMCHYYLNGGVKGEINPSIFVVDVFGIGMVYGLIRYKIVDMEVDVLYHNIIKTMGNFLIITDREQKVVQMNEKLKAYFEGYPPPEYLEAIIQDTNIQKVFSQSSLLNEQNIETHLLLPNQEQLPVLLSYSKVITEGDFIGAIFIASDVSLLKEKEKLLQQSNKELEEFAYVASHDIKEPLRMMEAYSDLLQKRHKKDLGADGQEFIEFIHGGAKRLRQMVEGLLTYARLGKEELRFEAVNLQEVIDMAQINLRKAVIDREATIECPQTELMIKGHRISLIRLFQNLIGNSIKYCPHHAPHIQIHIRLLEEDEQMLEIEIQDNGIGIPEQDLDDVFEIFKRSNQDQAKGTGIGLATCKKIVELHQGEIRVASKVGEGTQFFFTLAKAKIVITEKDLVEE